MIVPTNHDDMLKNIRELNSIIDKLQRKYNSAKDDLKNSEEEVDKYEESNRRLREQNRRLRDKNEVLQEKLDKVEKENRLLRRRNNPVVQNQPVTLYKTRTGKKYHRSNNCQYCRGKNDLSSFSIDVNELKNFVLCSRC